MKSIIIAEFDKIVRNHKELPFTRDKKNFQQFINGLYQAEGTMGAYFPKKDSMRIAYNFAIGQNYSPEALAVLLDIQKIMDVGRVIIQFNVKNQPHIRYIVSNTEDIFNVVIPYFSLLYGQKRKDISSLKRIYEIYSSYKHSELDSILITELIHLIYSINPWGQKRSISLTEKLNIFNCSLSTSYNLEVEENFTLPSKLFIMGLFIGDGSIGFVFDSPISRLPRFHVKLFFNFASQNNNFQLLNNIAKVMNLKPQIFKDKSGMMGLKYTGTTVYKVIIPFLTEYEDWLYWRKDKFNLAQIIMVMIQNKEHLTKEGLESIVHLLYTIPNQYKKPKDYWINLIDKHLWK